MTEVMDVPPINAEPTKAFFIDMLTRDIQLEQAVLDLVDNSVDGAKATRVEGARPYEGRHVAIEFNRDRFRILDNCGGFTAQVARDYAFRFGRPVGTPRTNHSIGQFGVGMKRALFKFGRHFAVRSATHDDAWAVDVSVPEWEQRPDWTFGWGQFMDDERISKLSPGTEISVTNLRQEVSTKFGTTLFQNSIVGLIKAKHGQFIAEGLTITVNGVHVVAESLYLLVNEDGSFRPGIDELVFADAGQAPVSVRIVVGVGRSLPREAGWYVICNGRVILEADRRPQTGWGLVEEVSQTLVMPNFHNQFARFRGIVSFDSDDSSLVPWNTTKTDVDLDNSIWQRTFGRMMEMMRPVITFLNELDSDIDEHTKEHSPLHDFVNRAVPKTSESIRGKSIFRAPARNQISKRVVTVKVQYSRPVDQVQFLMDELSVTSAKAAGERSFDLIFERMGGK